MQNLQDNMITSADKVGYEGRLVELLQEAAELTRSNVWVPLAQAEVTDEMALGMALSKYFDYNGQSILEAAREGLEDSNFHQEVEQIDKMIEAL